MIETVRQALNRLAVAAADWLWPRRKKGWLERYELPAENARLPKDDTKRQALAAQVGAEGFALLTAVYTPATPDQVRQSGAVEILRQIWIQQYYRPDQALRWRSDADVRPAGQLIHCPYDLEARYSSKRGVAWVGYKVDYTETCDLDRPKLITNVLTTPATIQDDTLLGAIHTCLAAKGLLPAEHLLDCGYTDADNLLTSQTEHGVLLIGGVADDPSWQARAGDGFAKANFTLDWQRQYAICPIGKQSYSWLPNNDATLVGSFQVLFSRASCWPCRSRAQCICEGGAAHPLSALAERA